MTTELEKKILALTSVTELLRVLDMLISDKDSRYLTTQNVGYLKECLNNTDQKVKALLLYWKDIWPQFSRGKNEQI